MVTGHDSIMMVPVSAIASTDAVAVAVVSASARS